MFLSFIVIIVIFFKIFFLEVISIRDKKQTFKIVHEISFQQQNVLKSCPKYDFYHVQTFQIIVKLHSQKQQTTQVSFISYSNIYTNKKIIYLIKDKFVFYLKNIYFCTYKF